MVKKLTEWCCVMNDLNNLGLTAKDIELIESALHTQKKILSVQSQAGGTGAGRKLAELKRLSARIGRLRSVREPNDGWPFSYSLRSLFCSGPSCSQTR